MAETSLAKQETKAKEYLRYIQQAQKALTLAQQRRSETRETIDGLRAICYDNEGKASTHTSGDARMLEVLERLERVEQAVQDKAQDYVDTLEEWQVIGANIEPYTYELLDAHYMQGISWEQLAQRLNIAERTVYRERVMALSELYSALPPAWQ